MLNGHLPALAPRLGREWVALHAAELEADWDRAQDLEPLVAIDPLPSIPCMLRVTAVTPLTPLTPRHLRVESNDGLVRDTDCSFLMHGTLGKPLKIPITSARPCR